MGLSPQGFQLSVQGLCTGKRRHIFDIVQIVHGNPPRPAQEPEGTLDPLITPFQVFLRRRSEEAEDSGRVRPVLQDKIVRIHDVFQRF